MKKKKIMALLVAMSVAAALPSVFADPMVVYASANGSNKDNQDSNYTPSVAEGSTVEKNTGRVGTNYGEIVDNQGTVDYNYENSGKIESNNGTVDFNGGTVGINNGTVAANHIWGEVTTNANNGTVTNNQGKVSTNNGTVTTNATEGTVETNNGTVTNNIGKVSTNNGTVTTNNQTVETNDGTVETNYGVVETNNGTVKINEVTGLVRMKFDGTSDEATIAAKVKSAVEKNLGMVDVQLDGQDVSQVYYGVSFTGNSEDSALYLDSIKKGETYTFKLPSGYGVEGNVKLSKDNPFAWSDAEYVAESEGNYYIIKEGDKIIVNGIIQFEGKWYKISSSGSTGEVTVEEVTVEEVTSAAPARKFMSNNATLEINGWSDVESAMDTDSAVTAITSDVKLFKLELFSDDLAVPANVVNSFAASKLDGMHFFIGSGDAVTFVKSDTLGNYVATDFSHTDTENDKMKLIDFTAPQEIGTTVLLSTTVPVNNAPVAAWMLVDDHYELIGQYESTQTGNVAFPITATGKYALTY